MKQGLYCGSEYVGRKISESFFDWSTVPVEDLIAGTVYPTPKASNDSTLLKNVEESSVSAAALKSIRSTQQVSLTLSIANATSKDKKNHT